MKMVIIFLVIFIHQDLVISTNYNFEIIEELIPKTIFFKSDDFNSFKIFQYIPSCSENDKYQKSIYLQILSIQRDKINIYAYDDFSQISQKNDSIFENFINHVRIYNWFESVLFMNLDCKKEYYFVMLLEKERYFFEHFPTLSGLQLTIIDSQKNIIQLTPELSDIFSFHQRNKNHQEIIFYSHNKSKYGLFSFNPSAKVQIYKNNSIIYDKREEDYKKEMWLEKDENYTIYLNGNISTNFFSLQLFNEPPSFKYDLTNGPIALYYSPFYNFEIDISKYELNDTILLDIFSYRSYSLKYQYKNNFKKNEYIDLGLYDEHNFIPIKKEINDSSLVINIEIIDYYYSDLNFFIINLISDLEEIKSEFKQEIKGPKYYYIEFFEFNNLNSIGIWANESFFVYEEEKKYKTTVSNTPFSNSYQNIFITKLNNYSPNSYKSAIIFFNSTNNILFEIKKFNYSFLEGNSEESSYGPDYEFFQLCQGNDTLNELYFYVYYDIFYSVFGTFDSIFINSNDIKNLANLDFDKLQPKKNNDKLYITEGFLKIKCKNPLMLKHSFYKVFYGKILNDGQKYYLNLNLKTNYTFHNSLINKDLKIKISIFGLEPTQSIKLFFNNNIYNLTNKLFEFNFTYTNYISDLFHFELDSNINNEIRAEINVAHLPENLIKIFKQIDFINSFGTLDIKKGEGVIIKTPYNFTKDLFDFSIIIEDNRYNDKIYIDISYDTIEFQTVNIDRNNELRPPFVIPLFKVNPYDNIENNLVESNDKFFYIIIYCYLGNKIYIKKPLLYSDAKFNKINFLPALIGNNSKYYYQIEFPISNENYTYLSIQFPKSPLSICSSVSKDNMQYSLLNKYDYYYYFTYYVIPLNKRNKNYFDFFNYYIDDKPGYFNFIPTIDNSYSYTNPQLGKDFIKNIQQIEGENKIKVELDSLSYRYYPNIIKYYLIINVERIYENTYSVLFSIITGQRQINETNHELMIILEDNGLNETFYKEIEITINLFENGKDIISIVPILNETNIIKEKYITKKYFEFKKIINKKVKGKKSKLLYYLIPIIVVVIIIIVAIIVYFKCKKRNNNDITVKKILEEELTNIDN